MPGPITPIPNYSDGNVLFAKGLLRMLGSDLNAGAISQQSTETALGSVLLSPTQASSGLWIIADGEADGGGSFGAPSSATFWIRVGSAQTLATNTIIQTKSLSFTPGNAFVATRQVTLHGWVTAPLGGFTGSLYIYFSATGSSLKAGDGATSSTNRGLWAFGF